MHYLSRYKFPIPLSGRTGWPWTEQSERLPDKMPDGRPWPKISVVTPSYNQGEFIEEAIRSVLLQDYPNLEYVIIDGGSTDDSVEIIKKYESWLTYWISEPDRGQSHAINKGIARSTGDILFWLNSDDIVLPGAFSTAAELFGQNPDVHIVTGQALIINSQGLKAGKLVSMYTSWRDYVTRKCKIRQVSTFFHRRLFAELGMIDESLEYSMDRDLLIRFTRVYPPLITESVLAAFRSHDTNKFTHARVAGYKESDRQTLRHLTGTDLTPEYLQWSSRNWLNQATNNNMGGGKWGECLWLSLRRDWKMGFRPIGVKLS